MRTGAVGAVVLLASAVSAAAAVALAPPATACSCHLFTTKEEVRDQLHRMPGVFVGTPVAVRETDETVSYEFNVERVYAGEIGARTVVSTPSGGAACGTGFAEGVEQVVVVSDRAVAGVDGPGDWNADMCSGGMFALQDGTRLDPRAAVEEALGTGEPPADIETTLAGERTREMARPLIAAVVLAALVGVGVFARRAWRARSG